MTNDHQQQELLHIQTMVMELERLARRGSIVRRGTSVTQPEYWRNRIHTLLATPGISGSTAARASALLAKLDRIAEAGRTADDLMGEDAGSGKAHAGRVAQSNWS